MRQRRTLHSQKQLWIHGQGDKISPLSIYSRLVAGTSTDINTNRKEYIFNTLAFWSIVVSVVATFYNLFEYFDRGKLLHWRTNPVAPITILVIFFILFLVSKQKQSYVPRYFFVTLIFLAGCYTSFQWGVNVPQSLLLFGFSIILAGVLISSKASLILILLTGVSLFGTHTIHTYNIAQPAFSWKNSETRFLDLIIYLGMFSLIAVVSWLSNTELERLLLETKRYAKQLQRERNLLEKRVKLRTAELEHAYEDLQKLEKQRYMQVNKLATLGKFSTGLIHDIVDPLTYVSTSLELALWKTTKRAKLLRKSILTALHGTKQIANLIESVRTGIRGERIIEPYSLKQTVNRTLLLLRFSARSHKVSIRLHAFKDITLYGNPSDVYQVLTNLLTNAVESYPLAKLRDPLRYVDLNVVVKSQEIVISVEDHGVGIPSGHENKVFDLFYTTKSSKEGTGIGLTMAREIARKNLKGTLTCTSTERKGTIFTFRFPRTRKHTSDR